MIVEADVLVRQPLAEYLRDCGYRVVEAADADEARLALSMPEVAIDIVLTNVNAKESGFTLASWIRANCPTVEVVLVGTVASECEKAGDLCEEGPVQSKPYDHQIVYDRIRQLLAARDRTERNGKR